MPTPQKASGVPSILRQWHAARRMELEIVSLSSNGKPYDERTLHLLNLWIACGGAFNASRQDYFESWRRLEAVLNSTYQPPRP